MNASAQSRGHSQICTTTVRSNSRIASLEILTVIGRMASELLKTTRIRRENRARRQAIRPATSYQWQYNPTPCWRWLTNGVVGDVWGADWAWGIPMLLVCVAFHVCGLVGLEGLLRWFEERRKMPRSMGYFLVMMLIIANIVLLLHVVEAGAWAYLLMKLGSIDNFRMALL